MTQKVSIFNYTCKEFCKYVKDTLGKGHEIAAALYKSFFKNGSFDLSLSQFPNAQSLIQTIVDLVDTTQMKELESLSDDVSTKFLLSTHDGYAIESVQIPMKLNNTLCVSSQVGCRMGCTFCQTGLMGLKRNLEASEIVQQVMHARFLKGLCFRNVVFMGMGEPFDNYENVKRAIAILSDQSGLAIAMNRITVSTSGKAEYIRVLGNETEIFPNLAVSINAPNDIMRNKLMPHNRKENLQVLYDAMKEYNERTKKEILIAYVLLKSYNDDLIFADELSSYLRGLDVKINLIPYNSQESARFCAPCDEKINAFKDALKKSGFSVMVRKNKGRSIMGACGQLGRKISKNFVHLS